MKDEFIEYELVLETHNSGDRAIIKSILDAEGITYYIQGEHVAPYVYHAVPMRLMVRKDRAMEAREVLKDIDLSFTVDGFQGIKNMKDDED